MQSWVKMGNVYYYQEVGVQMDNLPPHVFRLDKDPLERLYLTEISPSFTFPGKLYDIEHSFVDRAVKSFRTLGGNMGILLNGVKGTGKTVTAKLIANKTRLPIIIVHEDYVGIPTFINTLKQEAVFFFDEYEKVYPDYNHDILTVMDGVMTTAYKKLFLLTTNESHVNYNMLQRPGRIRYFKTFGDLDRSSILEVIDDTLKDKKFREDIIKFVSGLEIITIDIIKAVVEEVNIHNEDPEKFAEVFNVKKIQDAFDVYEVMAGGRREPILKGVSITMPRFSKLHVGRNFGEAGEEPIGRVVEVAAKNKAILARYDEDGMLHEGDLFTVEIQEASGIHSHFAGYTF